MEDRVGEGIRSHTRVWRGGEGPAPSRLSWVRFNVSVGERRPERRRKGQGGGEICETMRRGGSTGRKENRLDASGGSQVDRATRGWLAG